MFHYHTNSNQICLVVLTVNGLLKHCNNWNYDSNRKGNS